MTRILLAAFLCMTGATCIAQAAQPWDSNVITLAAPTQCTTGEPVSACPVTGYRYETSATATGTFTVLATVAATTFTHTGVTAGQHCYRAVAISVNGNSDPSNVSCKTNVKPVGPPNPPTLTIAALAGLAIPLDSLDGFKRTVAYTVTSGGPGVLAAFCKIATPSAQDNIFTYRGQAYCKPLANHPRTGEPNCAFVKGVSVDSAIAAPCA